MPAYKARIIVPQGAQMADKKNFAPDFSNVQGGSSSSAPAPSSGPRTVTVKAGDSLSKIAKRELGDANKWRVIFDANRDKISNPDLIHPGQVLNIPLES
jgi:nucleoid-associated protein YgaU